MRALYAYYHSFNCILSLLLLASTAFLGLQAPVYSVTIAAWQNPTTLEVALLSQAICARQHSGTISSDISIRDTPAVHTWTRTISHPNPQKVR